MVNGDKPGKNPPVPALDTEMAKDVAELMRYIKKSDYKIIDQLSQTPSKISILSLLRDFESHRNALMKLLVTSFVPQEISGINLKGL